MDVPLPERNVSSSTQPQPEEKLFARILFSFVFKGLDGKDKLNLALVSKWLSLKVAKSIFIDLTSARGSEVFNTWLETTTYRSDFEKESDKQGQHNFYDFLVSLEYFGWPKVRLAYSLLQEYANQYFGEKRKSDITRIINYLPWASNRLHDFTHLKYFLGHVTELHACFSTSFWVHVLNAVVDSEEIYNILPLLPPTVVFDSLIIQRACRRGNTKLVEHLLRDIKASLTKEETIDILSLNENYCLTRACQFGHLDIVQLLLNAGVDPKYPNNQPVIYAAAKNHGLIVDLLIERGVDPTYPNNDPLMRAVENQHEDMVLYLLTTKGMDPRIPDNEPLIQAISSNATSIATILLEIPIDPIFPNGPKLIDPNSPNGRPMVTAVGLESDDMVRLLIKNGGDPAFPDNLPLLNAVSTTGKEGVVGLLLEKGVDPNIPNNAPLLCAVRNEDEDMVKRLVGLSERSNKNRKFITDDNLVEAFFTATKEGNLTMTMYIAEFCGVSVATVRRALVETVSKEIHEYLLQWLDAHI